MGLRAWSVAAILALGNLVEAQTFRRLGACPTLGCVFPPDQADFLAGQYFDIRVEVHAPVNGSEASNNGVPDKNFYLTIKKRIGPPTRNVTQYFNIKDVPVETWTFSYFEDLFAQDARTPIVVNVASKVYRRVALYEPGHYSAVLNYNGGQRTVARWYVRKLSDVRKTKNVLLFIGDGMTTNMITAARLIGHKQANGRYQTTLSLDKFPSLGHQMTHSIDSFITDSANSATALYCGHKSTVNALGVYVDSSPDPFDDPKFESIAEIFARAAGGHSGIVSTAFIADATPAAFTAKTADRGRYAQVVDSILSGARNGSWPAWGGFDVVMGGGAEQFYPQSNATFLGRDYYRRFANRGYNVVSNLTALKAAPNKKTLGIFTRSNLPVWLDRNIYKDNLGKLTNDPYGASRPALDIPGLKDMTVKAIDILAETSGDKGWFLMSEAASVDKQMHALDYDRALGDLLELDDTVRASIEKLTQLGQLQETLILVTADHGHGFDVMGSVDTKYLNAQGTDRAKRRAVGTYKLSGESQYVVEREGSVVPPVFYTNGSYFPAQWDPRYTLFQGVSANPDHRENYQVHSSGPRTPAVPLAPGDYYVNPADAQSGFIVNGTLPPSDAQGVHSLTDVAVYAMGPCQELFSGTYNSIDIFYGMAECLGLSRFDDRVRESEYQPPATQNRLDSEHDWYGAGNGEDWWESSDHWGF